MLDKDAARKLIGDADNWLIEYTPDDRGAYSVPEQLIERLASDLQAALSEIERKDEAIKRVIDQPDTHPTIGGRWIDWAKGRLKKALYGPHAALTTPSQGGQDGE